MLTSRGPDPPSTPSTLNSVPVALRELGYVEGQNLVIERRFAEGKFDRLPELARELVRLRMDVIVANGAEPTQAAKDATSTIPIVMSFVGDPIGPGFVRSLARPGGNITGVALGEGALVAKRLELIKEVVPRATALAYLADGRRQAPGGGIDEVQKAAGALRVKAVLVDVKDGDYDAAFATMMTQRVGALHADGPLFFGHRARIIALAAKHRLPAIYEWRQAVEEGGLMSYGPKFSALFPRVATYIDRLFKGATPAEMPVELPTVFELLINLRTAKALGLTIPPSLGVRADEMIQ